MTAPALQQPEKPRPLPSLGQVRAKLARRSLAEFFRQSWHVLEQTPLVWNWHLEVMCDHVQALLEGRLATSGLVLNVPPGSSKSRIVSVCTTPWVWIQDGDWLNPSWSGIYTSGNPRLVMRDSVYARRIMESLWYRETFNPTWKFRRDQNAKGMYANDAGGFRQAMGGGAATTGDRARALFMDDMIDAAKAESKAEREAFPPWYDLAFANRVTDMKRSTRCMVAQRLHELDPAGHLLKSGEYEQLKIRQEYALERANPLDQNSPLVHRAPTSIGWSDPRRTPGELMDPVRFPAEELVKEKTRLGTRGYSAQHQQDPAPAEGHLVKRVWFKWFKMPTDANGVVLPAADIRKMLGLTRVGQGVDTALSEKTSADYTCDITIGEAPARFYVLDYWKDKVDAPGARSMVVSLRTKWMANVVVIEGGSSASGKATYQAIHADTTLPIIEIPVVSDKVVGLNAVVPTIEAGVVYLPENMPWAHELVESLTKFPTAAHDDDVDAFRLILSYLLFGGGATGLLDFMNAMLARTQGATAPVSAAPPMPSGATGGFLPSGR